MKIEQPSEKPQKGTTESLKNPREMAQMYGDDVELAYGSVLAEFGTVKGGIGDQGKDFRSIDQKLLPSFQIKSSWEGAKYFLAESVRRHNFIPVAIGEPGTAEEIIESIKEFGGWVGKDEPLRGNYLKNIKKVRDAIEFKSPQA